MKKEVLIGKIITAHGIKGHVKIISFTQNPVDIVNYKTIFNAGKKRFFELSAVGNYKGHNDSVFIVKIAGINDRNQAELLKNTELFIDYDQLPTVAADEFYYVDLIGLIALDKEGKQIGKVVNVADFGAGGIIEIQFDVSKKLQMLSFSEQTVIEVNIKQGYIIIDQPDILEVK